MTTLAVGAVADHGSESAVGIDLVLIRVGRALEAWGTRRARRAFVREEHVDRHADARSTAAALAHSGMLPR